MTTSMNIGSAMNTITALSTKSTMNSDPPTNFGKASTKAMNSDTKIISESTWRKVIS